MADLIINISGSTTYKLDLSLHDAAESDSTEVWCATFTEVDHDDNYVVFFEVDSSEDVEVWDLINLAIEAYRLEV
jgi:hypothetical protein